PDASSTGTLLLSLSTIAVAKISNPSWVIFQSAGWVSFQSAPTFHYVFWNHILRVTPRQARAGKFVKGATLR
ncbi:hypothetical protein, partial [Pseudomonas sp. RL_35y_Pfl2_P42]|uniref:hypothetical protein n=1 Tax=Pseudomonas sp. RL_35y_Pfl2_P42 TaxID=3088710 RepID=UPI0030DD5696